MANAIARGRSDTSTIMMVGALLGVFMILGLLMAAGARDSGMAVQAWTFIGLAGSFLVGMLMWAGQLLGRNPFDQSEYENAIVKWGVWASMFWGIAGLLVGVVIALQLTFPNLLYFPEWGFTNFGRLRPLHTSAVIFAFGGNVLIATSFYVVQRTCRARLAGGMWPWFVFWGYQIFIVLAATGYLLGITQSKGYA